MNRVVENNKVAVLYSPGFGAGWFSWHGVEDLIFDPMVVELVRNNRKDEIEVYVANKYGADIYCGGSEQLQISWIPIGDRFRIEEYDGSESVVTESEYVWLIA